MRNLSRVHLVAVVGVVGMVTVVVGSVAGCGSSTEIDGLAAFTRVDVNDVGQSDGVRLAGNLSQTLLTPGFLRGEGGNGLRLNANVAYSDHSDDEFTVWSPQIGPSFRLGVGGLYVEPGVTVGGAFAELGDDTEASWAVRPYGRVGLASDMFIVGVEGGYQYSNLEFDFGDDPQAWYIGGYFGIRLGH